MTDTPNLADRFGPRARVTDPDTSHQAAASVRPSHTEQLRTRILAIIDEFGPIHDEHIIDLLEVAGVECTPSGVRTRRHELAAVGLIVRHPINGTTSSGRACARWVRADQ